jgi:hypothetical protein
MYKRAMLFALITPPTSVKEPPTYRSLPLTAIALTGPLIAFAGPTRFQVLLALFQRAML